MSLCILLSVFLSCLAHLQRIDKALTFKYCGPSCWTKEKVSPCLLPPPSCCVCVCSERCVEVFLYQLFAMLKATPYNVALLAGKSILETLLDTFAALYLSSSERCTSEPGGSVSLSP